MEFFPVSNGETFTQSGHPPGIESVLGVGLFIHEKGLGNTLYISFSFDDPVRDRIDPVFRIDLSLCLNHLQAYRSFLWKVEKNPLYGKLGLSHFLSQAVDVFPNPKPRKKLSLRLEALFLKTPSPKLKGDTLPI